MPQLAAVLLLLLLLLFACMNFRQPCFSQYAASAQGAQGADDVSCVCVRMCVCVCVWDWLQGAGLVWQ
jgi:hypothetical protein